MRESRPIWSESINREKFIKLVFTIKKVSHHWKFTSEDTSDNWIELHTEKESMREPKGFSEYFEFRPDHRCLFNLTYKGEQALKLNEEIKKWETKNKKEIAEYKRLKALYE